MNAKPIRALASSPADPEMVSQSAPNAWEFSDTLATRSMAAKSVQAANHSCKQRAPRTPLAARCFRLGFNIQHPNATAHQEYKEDISGVPECHCPPDLEVSRHGNQKARAIVDHLIVKPLLETYRQ